MGELRDSAIWAATCDLTARVLRNDRRRLAARAALPGLVLVALGVAATSVLPAAAGLLLAALGFLPVLAAVALLAARGSTAAGHLVLEGDGFTYRAFGGPAAAAAPAATWSWQDCGRFGTVRSWWGAGHVVWARRGGGRGGAFLPGAGGLPPDDLAVLLNRYRDRFAPDGTSAG